MDSLYEELSMVTHVEIWHVGNGVRAVPEVYSILCMSIARSEGRTLYMFLVLEILLSTVAGSTARLPVCNVTINH